jgi:predicted SAM-dependent methyltransferase
VNSSPDQLAHEVVLPSRWTTMRGNPALRAAVSAVNTPMAKRRGRRAYDEAPRPIKLELGGVGARDGWLITNVNPIAKLYLDATVRWPFEDGAAAYVFSDNVIEHVPLPAGRAMLRETYRCLRPGGVVRITTPDLRKHVTHYLSGEDAVTSRLADEYRSLGIPVEHPLDLIRITAIQFGHDKGYLYDFETLKTELEAAGFQSVVECALGESEHQDLRGLDSRPGFAGGLMAVEATR